MIVKCLDYGSAHAFFRHSCFEYVTAKDVTRNSNHKSQQERNAPAPGVPQASSVAVDMLAAKAAPTAEPSRVPIAQLAATNAPIKPRRPSGACSTRNTIELGYSPPTESPCTTRSKVSPIGASTPMV